MKKAIITVMLTLFGLNIIIKTVEARHCSNGRYRRGRGPSFSFGYGYPYAYHGPLDYPGYSGPGWGPFSDRRYGVGFGFSYGG